jgi:hypothetical protein
VADDEEVVALGGGAVLGGVDLLVGAVNADAQTRTRTPRPSGVSSTDGFAISVRWIEFGVPG